jgi:GNAT superfamily N-acetyltransferase
METIDELKEGPLQDSDIPGALALVAEAGWNQVAEDWRVFFDLGRAFGLWSAEEGLVATAATLRYSGGFEWISMVLVRGTWRRRGLATHLLDRCIETVLANHSIPVLDATPAGREVYKRLGFRDDWPLTRWYRIPGKPVTTTSSVKICPLSETEWPAVIALDENAFGSSRRSLLERLARRSHEFACVAFGADGLCGFLLGRDGRNATHLGPIVANDQDTACALVAYAASKLVGPVYIDILDRHDRFRSWLLEQEFSIQRPFTRMAMGSGIAYGDAQQIMAIAGPELG